MLQQAVYDIIKMSSICHYILFWFFTLLYNFAKMSNKSKVLWTHLKTVLHVVGHIQEEKCTGTKTHTQNTFSSTCGSK